MWANQCPSSSSSSPWRKPVKPDSLTDGGLRHGEQRLLRGHSKASVDRQTDALQVEEKEEKLNEWINK